ncbi:MAG TPA: hypothetical protein VEM93_01120 [Actinomycetota bacterium]|nr:hypothetical protein [Actinomycetota bacterium]
MRAFVLSLLLRAILIFALLRLATFETGELILTRISRCRRP